MAQDRDLNPALARVFPAVFYSARKCPIIFNELILSSFKLSTPPSPGDTHLMTQCSSHPQRLVPAKAAPSRDFFLFYNFRIFYNL